jgi:hypothetical protein
LSANGSFISHDAAASLLQVAPDELTRLVSGGVVRRPAPGKYVPAQVIRDYISHLQREPDRRDRAPTQVEIGVHLDMSDRNLRDVLEQLGLSHTQASLAEIRVAYIRRLREHLCRGRVNNIERGRTCNKVSADQHAEIALEIHSHFLLLDRQAIRFSSIR